MIEYIFRSIVYREITELGKVFILGGEGNGLVIAAAIIRNNPSTEVAFLCDNHMIGDQIGKKREIPVKGSVSDIVKLLDTEKGKVISAFGGFVNHPQNGLRVLNDLKIDKDKWLTFIDQTAVVPYEFCDLGMDVFIGPLAQLSPDVTISNHCSIFGNAFVGHDSIIGEFCHLATNSVIGSNVTVGCGVHIGSNSVVREHIVIGDYSIIGAGAVVVKDVPENAIVVGNPAKILKMRGD